MPIKHNSFTINYHNHVNVITSKVVIYPAFDPRKPGLKIKDYPGREFLAIWDTGATSSAITDAVVQSMNLKPIGIAEVHTASGNHRVNKYIINIRLPNKVGFPEVIVICGNIAGPAEVLIGMDIIRCGDFAISNKDKNTVFSFRIPSVETIDFVKNPFKENPLE